MTTAVAPICMVCKHLREDPVGFTCDAYPEGIPEEIVLSEVDHREPFRGDNGIQFEQNPNEAPVDRYVKDAGVVFGLT